ncbi:extracellular solute-binding protein [Bradyrhizobium sp. ISRA435]|nr:extracellular solute-binding protein [Bradyrhizobium sp. ISRA435]
MDRVLGPAFEKAHGVQFQGIGMGSYALARLLAAKQQQADVFVSITPGPVKVVQEAGLLGEGVPVASTQMVITYSPKSRFASQFEAAAADRTPWWQVLKSPGLRFGRTDPAIDPQGQNIIFTMLLAERYYNQPDLVSTILGSYQNPRQIFTEPSLLTRLEGAQIDAASGYQSAAISHHLPYVPLPDEINLSNPDKVSDWYSKVAFTIKLPSGKEATLQTQPLVFYAGVLKNAQNPELGKQFVDFLLSPEGQKLFRDSGYAEPKGGRFDERAAIRACVGHGGRHMASCSSDSGDGRSAGALFPDRTIRHADLRHRLARLSIRARRLGRGGHLPSLQFRINADLDLPRDAACLVAGAQ